MNGDGGVEHGQNRKKIGWNWTGGWRPRSPPPHPHSFFAANARFFAHIFCPVGRRCPPQAVWGLGNCLDWTLGWVKLEEQQFLLYFRVQNPTKWTLASLVEGAYYWVLDRLEKKNL